MKAWLFTCFVFAFAVNASAAEYSYVGVIGRTSQLIGVFSSEGRTWFAKAGSTLRDTSIHVEAVEKNKIVLTDQQRRIVLRPLGSSIEGKSSGIVDRSSMERYLENSEELDQNFSRLVELGNQAVASGDMTPDQVRQVLAEEEEARAFIEATDQAFAARSIK